MSLCCEDVSNPDVETQLDEQVGALPQETPEKKHAASPEHSDGDADNCMQLQAWKERSTRMEQLLAKKNTRIQEMEETVSPTAVFAVDPSLQCKFWWCYGI